MAAAMPRRRFTVDDYHRMAEAGILGEDDRVELIEGEIVEMSPLGPKHMRSVNRLTHIVVPQLGSDAEISVQNSIRLSTDGEPQPDVAVLSRQRDQDTVPLPTDVFLVIEVADSSRDYDRNVKLPMYAAAGIPEAWLFDLVAEIAERHSDPWEGRYRVVAHARRGESLTSTVLPGLTIAVDDVLG